MMNDCNTLQPQQGYFCDSSRHRTSKGQQDPGWPPLGQQMSCQRSIHLQQLTGAFTLPVSSSRRLYSNSISSNRTWQLQQQQRNMAAAQSVAADGQHSVDWQAYNARWQDIWQGGLQKGQAFDKGHCSPQLLHLISTGQLKVQGKKAFVPGCGRGYDVFAFALAGASVSVGLDICPIAVQAAKDEQQLEIGTNAAACAASQLVSGDFFSHERNPDFQGPYDIGYDYTFLCALHPEMRQGWARTWARLLAPGGELLTMVYPVDASLGEGPPWPVTPELYKQLLPPAGFELVSLEPIPHQLSHESRRGREWLGRWFNKNPVTDKQTDML